MDNPDELERRRDEAVGKMRRARAEITEEVAGLSGLQAFRGDEWSIAHVLAHLSQQAGGHLAPALEIIQQGRTEIEPFSREVVFRRTVDLVMSDIDACMAFSRSLGREQLMRHARQGQRRVYVIGFIEQAAEHLLGHVDQIRQIKARLGYAPSDPDMSVTAGEIPARTGQDVGRKDVGRREEENVDPVCGMEVDPQSAAGSSTYEGTTYYFCSDGCRQQFERAPLHFL